MAKKFRFRFEPMLKVRKHIEKERQKDHAEALGAVNLQKQQLSTIDQERIGTMEHLRQQQRGPLSLAEMLICSRYLLRLKRERVTGSELLFGLEKKAEDKRQELVQAAKERKIYELLKEKQGLRHRQEVDKAELKEIDDVATDNFRRKSNK